MKLCSVESWNISRAHVFNISQITCSSYIYEFPLDCDVAVNTGRDYRDFTQNWIPSNSLTERTRIYATDLCHKACTLDLTLSLHLT